MSGGSYNYLYKQIEWGYVDRMYDSQLNEMMKDLVKVLHDLEWWQSGNTGEEEYRNTVTWFKRKWFKRETVDVQKMIEIELELKKKELLKQFEYMEDDYDGFEECK